MVNETDQNHWLDNVITSSEAARLIGKSARWVRELVRQNKLVGKQISPRLLVISRRSVEEYLKQQDYKIVAMTLSEDCIPLA